MKLSLRTTIALTAVAALLVAAACTSGDDGDASPAPPAAQSEAAPAPPAVPSEAPSAAASPAADPQDTAGQTASFQEQMEDKPDERPQPVASAREDDDPPAPELTGLNSWINSEPLTIEEQRGRVVLIDFWTYTCINCIRTLPYLKEWHEKYADEGLVIIGIHTPEFDFEKDRDNVIDASMEFGLEYAIAQDNDYRTWNAFENRFWPAKYLIDKDGYIRYTHFGEGAYVQTEEKIQQLLAETGSAAINIPTGEEPEQKIDPRARSSDPASNLTRELYAGFERNQGTVWSGGVPYVGHREYYDGGDVIRVYELPDERYNHFLYLHGAWHTGQESLTHARATDNLEDFMVVPFNASSVNVVLSPEDGEPYRVLLRVDGEPIGPTQAGGDILWDDTGNSYVLVDESRMYWIVDIPEFGMHELTLASDSDDFAVFAFTFGAFVEEY